MSTIRRSDRADAARPAATLLAAAAAAGAAWIVTAACGPPAQEWRGTIEERDGVVYVGNPHEGLWQGRDPAPIRFELEQTFGVESEPAEAILGGIGSHAVAVDGDGNVYVYDYPANQLVAFAADGNLRWRGGRTGQGPGEFTYAEGVAWAGGTTLYIANTAAQRLEEWTTGGAFVASHALGERDLPHGALLGFLDPNTLVMRSFPLNTQAGARFGTIDVRGEWSTIAEGEVDVASRDMGRNVALATMAAVDGFATAGDIDSYELRFFDREGAPRRVVSREFPQMVGYARAGERSTVYSWLDAPLRLASGHWIALSSWVDVDDADADYVRRLADGTHGERPWKRSLDLFDPDGRFLYALVSDEPAYPLGRPALTGPDGTLYTTANDPYPQVRRYRVIIEE